MEAGPLHWDDLDLGLSDDEEKDDEVSRFGHRNTCHHATKPVAD